MNRYERICEAALEASKRETQVYNKHWIDSPWSGFFEVRVTEGGRERERVRHAEHVSTTDVREETPGHHPSAPV